MRCSVFFALIALVLASCGGGGGGTSLRQPPPTGPQPPPYDRSQATVPYGSSVNASDLASNPPAFTDVTGRAVIVGTPNIVQVPYRFDRMHGTVEVGHMRVRDGIGASELRRYLRADAAFRGVNRVLRWGDTPPTVRMIEGATERDWEETLTAVRMLNSALPPDWQVRFSDTEAAPDGRVNSGFIEGSVRFQGILARSQLRRIDRSCGLRLFRAHVGRQDDRSGSACGFNARDGQTAADACLAS